jgi:NAD-dependent protein deacetylase/lipoamidase
MTRPDPVPQLPLTESSRLLVVTGAGISAESGLATFRGTEGLWEDERVEEVATPSAFERDPARVWRFYSERRAAAAAALPNAAHLALAELERRMGHRFLLVTQNVDGLHAAAGSKRLVELHGSLWRSRCSRCHRPAFPDRRHPVQPPLPVCDQCADDQRGPAYLRPAVVWFDEVLDADDQYRVFGFLSRARADHAPLLFLAAGTSGTVYPAAAFVRHAAEMGASTWLANLERPENAGVFDHVVEGPATAVLPRLLGVEDAESPAGP